MSHPQTDLVTCNAMNAAAWEHDIALGTAWTEAILKAAGDFRKAHKLPADWMPRVGVPGCVRLLQ